MPKVRFMKKRHWGEVCQPAGTVVDMTDGQIEKLAKAHGGKVPRDLRVIDGPSAVPDVEPEPKPNKKKKKNEHKGLSTEGL